MQSLHSELAAFSYLLHQSQDGADMEFVIVEGEETGGSGGEAAATTIRQHTCTARNIA